MEPEVKKYLMDLPFSELSELYKRSKKADLMAGYLFILASVGLLGFIDAMCKGEEGWLAGFLLCATLLVGVVMIFARTRVGRFVGIVVSIFSLFLFPVGTIIGVLSMKSFVSTPRLFGQGRIKHQYIKAAYMVRNEHLRK